MLAESAYAQAFISNSTGNQGGPVWLGLSGDVERKGAMKAQELRDKTPEQLRLSLIHI